MKRLSFKISGTRVTRIRMPRVDQAWKTATQAGNAIDGFVLEIYSDGIVGIGGTSTHPNSISADALEPQLNGPVSDVLRGADILAGNMVRKNLRDARIDPRALLAADLALHDLMGKMAGLPCYALWGGAIRSSVAVVRMVGAKPPAELEEAALALINQGYRHLKVKIGTGISEDVERISVLRKVLGEYIWIGVDANGAYTPDQAIKLSRELVRFGVALIEQPTDYRNMNGLTQVTAASTIPIMADQCVSDAASALSLCQRQAAHIVSIKATKMGTLDECRRVAEICSAFGIRIHIGGSAAPAVVDAAQVQMALSLQAADAECEVGEFKALKEDPTSGLTIKDGCIEAGTVPGLGVSLHMAARHHKDTGKFSCRINI